MCLLVCLRSVLSRCLCWCRGSFCAPLSFASLQESITLYLCVPLSLSAFVFLSDVPAPIYLCCPSACLSSCNCVCLSVCVCCLSVTASVLFNIIYLSCLTVDNKCANLSTVSSLIGSQNPLPYFIHTAQDNSACKLLLRSHVFPLGVSHPPYL